MNANLMNRTIEMTKSEAKAAGKLNSDEWKEFREYQNAYPNFEIVIKASAKRTGAYRGLDYKYMLNYINNCKLENKSDILEKFKFLIASDKKNKVEGSEYLVASSYMDVKKWFLATFPEIKSHKEEHDKKRAEILAIVA